MKELMNEPVFGIDYDVGWAGFTFTPKEIISEAIGYGERWEERSVGEAAALPYPAVSHAFICTGAGTGIEAHIDTGVAGFHLAKYTADTKCRVYFRKPRGWTPDLGKRIAATAAKNPPLGCAYDTSLIAADAICDTITGHALDRLTRGWFREWMCAWLARPNRFICSETDAYVFQQQPELAALGCLKRPANTIDPQELFEDDEVFEGGFSGGEMWNRNAEGGCGSTSPPAPLPIAGRQCGEGSSNMDWRPE
jgi:hypothetical protein